ncbi:MAG: hypothetical protein K6F35_09675 [Lachnospiraceae bacterium]|nr:hypothetical protein [Lachnospiraceae bacterium]
MENNRLDDSQLEGVSGGQKTSTNFEITNGVVKFVDKNNVPMDISMADYNWLLTKYSGVTRRDQEVALATLNVGEIKSLLAQHAAGAL